MIQRFFPLLAARNKSPALEICKGRFVRRDHACARACFDAHVAKRHAAFQRKRAHRLTCILDHVSGRAVSADLADDAEREILCGDTVGQCAGRVHFHGARFVLRQALRCEHVFDFARADAKRERAKRAVRARVAVAAHDCHAGLGEPEFRADDVHDALFGRVNVKQLDAKLFAVAAQCFDLIGRDRVGDRQTAIGRRHVVVHRPEGQGGTANSSARLPQTIKRLGRRDLMNEVQIDIKERRLALRLTNDVRLPQFVEQGWHWISGTHRLSRWYFQTQPTPRDVGRVLIPPTRSVVLSDLTYTA